MADEKRSVPSELVGLLERPVAVYRIYCRIAGSVDGGVFLAQAVFWTTSRAARARAGYWSHEAQCIESITGVPPNTQATIRSFLRGKGILEERRTIGGRVAMRVDLQRLAECIREVNALDAPTRDDEKDSSCGCKDAGLAARAADVAAAKTKSESRNQDSRIQEEPAPESQQQGNQDPAKVDSLYPETTPETPPENAPKSPPPSGAGLKTPPPENGGGQSEILKDPEIYRIVGNAVEHIRHVGPIDDLRAFVVTALRNQRRPAGSSTITAIIAEVNARLSSPKAGQQRSLRDLVEGSNKH